LLLLLPIKLPPQIMVGAGGSLWAAKQAKQQQQQQQVLCS
jgi:hypothetical protein